MPLLRKMSPPLICRSAPIHFWNLSGSTGRSELTLRLFTSSSWSWSWPCSRKSGSNSQDALEVERALIEDVGERDLALLGLVDARVGVDRLDLGLDLREIVGAHEIGLC